MRRIHLLRPAEFTDARGTKVSLSESHIRDIAAGYDPARHEAPLVVGHPRSDKPAFGRTTAGEEVDFVVETASKLLPHLIADPIAPGSAVLTHAAKVAKCSCSPTGCLSP